MTGNRSTPDVAWIAGVGAQRGLGAALARRFARGGLAVVLTGRDADRLAERAREIRAAGGTAEVAVADVADANQLAGAAGVVDRIGRLRAALFNAGNAQRAPSLELSPAAFEEAWRTGAYGGFLFGREALRRLIEHGDGPASLAFTGATGSLRGKPPFAAFASSKAALRSLAQTFAREFGPRGVHVTHVVIDGGIDGERLRSRAPERVAAAGADGLLDPDAIAETYWQLHLQPRSAWTHEIDLRPFRESF